MKLIKYIIFLIIDLYLQDYSVENDKFSSAKSTNSFLPPDGSNV